MATRSGGSMMQDQNVTGKTVTGKANNIKGLPKEARPGGRRPLGDLSNVEKTAECQALKQSGSKHTNFIKEDIIPTKVAKDTSRNRTVKASGKLQTGGRKALFDISNSGKACSQGITNKLLVKVNGTKDEPYELDSISEEQFLHDHRSCIKEKSKQMGIEQFLETIGLDKDMFLHGASPSVVAASSKLQPEDCLKHLEMKDMEEQLCEVQCPSTECCDLINSSLPCSPFSSPISMSKSCDVNFKLMET